jgi:cytochrome c oxidase subunit 2
MDEIVLPGLTLKVVGHQWYWSYEYSDYITAEGKTVEFDSYLIPENDLEVGELRLLSVDEPVVLPVDTTVRAIVTATDVIHDFAVPSFGIKIDAIPGRLNQASILAQRTGTFYGQCSELCGVYHGFMPIQIEIVTMDNFLR